jgi:hypothetical protein
MEKKVIEIEVKDNSKTLKQQYKEAVLEVQKLADAFGATSIEVQNASKRAAELKDQIEDVNDAIQAQKGEGAFIALGKSLSTVASGFSAVEGAMGLVGAESEDVQKAMLRVQSAMALAQGLEGLEDAGRAFKQLGVVIKGTTIFQAAYNFVVYGTISATKAQTIATNIQTGSTVAASTATKALRIAMLALPIVAVVAGVLALANAMGVFGDATEDAEAKQKKLDAQLAKTNEELERQKRNSESLANFTDALYKQELIDAKNRGASEEELTKIKKAQQKERLKDLKQEYDEATKFMLKTSKTFTDRKQIDEATKLQNEAFKKYNDFRLEVEGDTADEVYEKRKTAVDKANQLRNSELEKIREYYNTARQENEARLRTEQEQEEFVINDKFKTQIALFKKYGKDTTELEIAQLNEINNVRLKYQELEYKQKEEARQKELDAIKEANQKRIELEDKQFEVMQGVGQTEKEKEIADLVKSYEDKFAIIGNNAILEKELTEQQKKDLAVIEEKYRKQKEEKDKETADKEIARQNTLQQTKLKLAGEAFGAIGQLIESFNAKDEATARKQFKIAKAFNLSSALVNTALAVTSALAMRPDQQVFPGQRFVEAGIAGTTGLASVVKIASTQFGGGGGGGGVDVPNPSSIIAPNLNVVGNTGINQLATLQQQPVKAYVVSNDITSAQQFDMKVQQTSQL